MKIRPTLAERLARKEQRQLKGETPKASRVERTPRISKNRHTQPSRVALLPVPIVEWHGCYDDSWRGQISPSSFAHPAKAARNLLTRIFQHLFDIGVLTKGQSIVVDPFAGIFTTGIMGAWFGVQVIGSELEEKFCRLAQENVALHADKWVHQRLPIPIIVQGDSRQLSHHIQLAVDAIVSSPPFLGADRGLATSAHARDVIERGGLPKVGHLTQDDYGTTEGQMAVMPTGNVDAIVSSPPYAEIASGAGGLNTKQPQHEGQQGGRSLDSASQDTDQRYGDSEGQLAKMVKGEVDAIISSPPYANQDNQGGDQATHPGMKWSAGERTDRGRVSRKNYQGTNYGQADGQLGVMKSDGVDAIISSPPYATDQLGGGGHKHDKVIDAMKAGYGETDGQLGEMNDGAVDAVVSSPPYEATDTKPTQLGSGKPSREQGDGAGRNKGDYIYGVSEGQLGTQTGDTFWSASLMIVRECFAVLRPGGYAVWIVKAFVRNKEIVDFPSDWRKLCEYVGFETLTEVHAMLVKEDHSEVWDFENEDKRQTITQKTERKSFFRRLAESKGSPKINYEVVWIMRKSSPTEHTSQESL